MNSKNLRNYKLHRGRSISSLLEKSGDEFWAYIRKVENSPLFMDMHKRGLIKVLPVLNLTFEGISPSCLRGMQLRILTHSKGEIVKKASRMDPKRFAYYFLENKGTDAEISNLLNITQEETKELRNSISLSNYKENVNISFHGEASLECVGFLILKKNVFKIKFLYPSCRYVFKSIPEEYFQREEIKKLFQKLEDINFRFKLLNRISADILRVQREFLLNNKIQSMQPYTLTNMAKKLKVNVGWVSRIISNKFIFLRKKRIFLRSLFITAREKRKKEGLLILEGILALQKKKMKEGVISRSYSDEEIRIQMQSHYNFKVSRRTINQWRHIIENSS